MTNFRLNQTLEKDSIFIKNLDYCQLRVINNKNFPWLILVPMENNIVELNDISEENYVIMCSEIRKISNLFQKYTKADKMNIATIGNVVAQMHIHIIARYKNDKLFPKPVWGSEFTPYEAHEIQDIISDIKEIINF